MGSTRFIQYFIVAQILSIALAVGLGYLFRFEIAHWILEEAIQEDRAAEREEEALIRSTDEKIVAAIERANPAVVSVVVTKEVPIYERYYEEYNPFGGLFGGFSIPRIREEGTEEREVGGGSGFIVTENGFVVTNRHVVADENASYSILTNDGESHVVEVVARDPVLDIAILRVRDIPEEYEFTPLTFGDSQNIKLGETVIAIGNALAEFRNSVSVGVVSGLSRSIVAGDRLGMNEQLDEVIQTDAAINLGNSGGPLLNLDGEVIGVNVAASLGAENIGFALPAHVVKGVVDSVVAHGEIVRPFLGVRYAMLTERMVEANDLPVEYGALIVSGETPEELAVMPGSPADRAGLEANDIILAIDGTELRDGRTLASVIRGKTVGEEVALRVFDDGEEREITVTLEKAPTD